MTDGMMLFRADVLFRWWYAFYALCAQFWVKIERVFASNVPGWRLKKGGHVLFHCVEKTSPTTVSFAVCNSGDGLSYHPVSLARYPKVITMVLPRYSSCLYLRLLRDAGAIPDVFPASQHSR
jgi:hypothetical protein